MLISRKDLFLSFLLFGAAILLLTFLIPQWTLSPNSVLMSDFGDGLKNTFSFTWFLAHEEGGLYVSGMNYPYGEHLVYLDAQPGLAVLLRPLGLGNYAVGVSQLILALSFAFGSVFLFLCARELGVRRLAAFLAGFTLVLLSPQLERLANHTTLTYISCLPGTWYLLLLTARMERKWIGVGILLLQNLFWTLIHPYLGLMIGMFAGGFWGLWILREAISLRFKVQWILYAGLLAFFHLAVFRGGLWLTDIHTGRPSIPGGFLYQLTSIYSLLFPRQGPIAEFWDAKWGVQTFLTDQDWEGFGYLGIVQIVFGVLGLILGGASLFLKRMGFRARDSRNMLMGVSLLASFIMLLFSMGYPFKWDPIWIERLSFLRQFRFLGRFNWFFVSVFGVFAWAWIDRIAEWLQNRWKSGWGVGIGVGIILICAGINLYEGQVEFFYLRQHTFRSPNPFVKKHVNEAPWELGGALESIDPAAYQSLIPVPFWFTGTESLRLPRVIESRQNGMILAHHTGLPLHAMDGARASVTQGKQQVALFGSTRYEKLLAPQITDNRPILIVHTPNMEMVPEEIAFLDRCEVVYEDAGIRLLSISREDLYAYEPVDWRSELPSHLYYNGFEDEPCHYAYRGTGAHSDWIGRYVVLFENERDAVELLPGHTYELSFWFRHVQDGIYRHTVILEQFNAAGENIGYDVRDDGKNSRTFDGDWVQMVYRFEIKQEAEVVRWFLNGDAELDLEVYIDGVMVREVQP